MKKIQLFGGKDRADGVTELWRRFERGRARHGAVNLYESTAEAYRMFEGDQWHGLEAGQERLPVFNIIAPTVEYKTATVAMQNMQIYYSPQDLTRPEGAALCEALNRYAARCWEKQKLDAKLWKVVQSACVAGDSYLYFYSKNIDCQIIDNTSIYFSDEQQPDIQRQEYILISERRPVGEVRREAKKNGVSAEEIERILPDADTLSEVGDTAEAGGDGKCLSLLCLSRGEDGFVRVCRATRNVVYVPESAIPGLRLYPIASYVWTPSKNSARGVGEVRPIVPNQIEINRLLARRLISAKQNAFAKPVFVENMVENPADVDKIGKAIRLRGSGGVQRVNDIFSYVAPAPMSGEAALLLDSLISKTRELSGAGDAALGSVNPEKASGAAIIAVRDQSAIPLNAQIAAFRQFVEDIALIWLDIWRAYGSEPIFVDTATPDGVVRRDEIAPGALEALTLDVRIDASPASPFSKYALEQSLEQARNAGYISFEEYVRALPENAIAPKNALTAILDARRN